MTETLAPAKGLPCSDGGAQPGPSALTIVRIKRRRDDPAEPEIILESAGARRNKQPRYDEVLLQFQGLAVQGAAAAPPPPAPRRRFRRLQTVEVSAFEKLSESEVLQLLRNKPKVVATTSTDGPARQPAEDGAVAADEALGFILQPLSPGQSEGLAQFRQLPPDAGQQRRGPVKVVHEPNPENRIAALRTLHRQAATAARYKQIRRKREIETGNGAEEGVLQVYDLERLPVAKPADGVSESQNEAPGHQMPQNGRTTPPSPLAPLSVQPQRGQRPAREMQPLASAALSQAPAGERRHDQGPGTAPLGKAARNPEEEELLRRYVPFVDEVMKSLSVQDPQGVRRIPARPKRAMKAADTKGMPAALTTPHSLDTQLAQQVRPAGEDSAITTAVSVQAGTTQSSMIAGASEADGGARRQASDDGGGDGFVYDVYVSVQNDDSEAMAEGAVEDPRPWLDAPAGLDMAVPVIEVAEDDDEFFWGGEVEAEAAQRAAAAEEHDSEDSNAESYYANSYPDEEAVYGHDDGSDDDDKKEPADADVGGGSGWGGMRVMGRRQGPFSDDDDDEDGERDEDDEEIFGCRNRRRRVRPAKASMYYRTEDDDYSEHSSFLSEDEEAQAAEERRRRAIFMH